MSSKMTGIAQGGRLLSLVVVMIASVLTGVTFGRHTSPFIVQDDDCPRNCSWSWGGLDPGTQFCEKTVYEDVVDVCPNPFPPAAVFDDRPPPADNVGVTEWNKVFNVATGQDGAMATEQYTCLSITYTIPSTSARNVKGLQFSVEATTNPDLGQTYCVNLNFSTDGLQYNAVVEELSGQLGRTRASITFSFECFCGLKPDRNYVVTVRTMPVDNSQGDSYDTKVQVPFSTKDCADPSKDMKDVRCLKNEEAQWSPQCITVRQNTTGGDYDTVEVYFDVAPSHFNFNVYKVFIYQELLNGPPEDYVLVNMDEVTTVNKTCSTLQTLNAAFVTLRFNVTSNYRGNPWDGDNFKVKVRPSPSINPCRDAEDAVTSCTDTISKVFSIIKNPCDASPCGIYGRRCTPYEELYGCDCMPGYMEYNQTCKRNF